MPNLLVDGIFLFLVRFHKLGYTKRDKNDFRETTDGGINDGCQVTGTEGWMKLTNTNGNTMDNASQKNLMTSSDIRKV